ncbi:MAG: hypothetical protein U0M21_01290 [Emergencia sp.]|nr:hypothetical protein [Emergencia sp.]
MKESINLMNVMKYAGAYIAFEIGSGFATGQEILQFYSAYGLFSIGGALISMCLFAWAGAKTMSMGFVLKNQETVRPYRLICGKHLGFLFEKFVLFYVFAGLCVMLSGAGASMAEYLGISHLTGSLLMAGAVFLSYCFGFKKMVAVIGVLGPVIIGGIVFVAGWTLISEFGDIWVNIRDTEVLSRFSAVKSAGSWWVSGMLYAGYNIVGSMAFLMAMGKDAATKKEAAAGGIAGGVILVVAVLFVNFALFACGDRIGEVMVPTLMMAKQISPQVGAIFAGILLSGIFSTAAPMLWTICDQLTDAKGGMSAALLALLICADALVLGQLPFDQLVSVIYPITGYLGIGLLLCLAGVNLRCRNDYSGQSGGLWHVGNRRL